MPLKEGLGVQDQDISISAFGTGSQWSAFAGRLKQANNGANGELLRLLHADLADHQVACLRTEFSCPAVGSVCACMKQRCQQRVDN